LERQSLGEIVESQVLARCGEARDESYLENCQSGDNISVDSQRGRHGSESRRRGCDGSEFPQEGRRSVSGDRRHSETGKDNQGRILDKKTIVRITIPNMEAATG